MKLISCFLEGFGKYENAQFTFNKGLTAFLMDNGEGKTTLATFLRVMLYGMATDSVKSYGIRSRYYPFHGGNYGGNLQVEWQGKTYKIVRYFDRKSAVKDVLTVTDDRGRECAELGEVPGLTIFGLTEEAFLRTSYITWQQTDIDLQHGIGERLCGLVSDSSSVPLDKALESLSEYEKTYHSGRRKGGVFTGYIPETEEKIASIQSEIYELEGLEKELVSVRGAYQKAYGVEADLGAEIEKMQEAGTRRTRWEYYQSLLASAQEERDKMAKLKACYPYGFPTEEEVKTLRPNLRSAQVVRARLQHRAFPKQDELERKELQFHLGIPTPERLDGMEGLVDHYLAEASAAASVYEQPKSDAKSKTKTIGFALSLLAVLLMVVGVLLVQSAVTVAAVLGVVGVALLAGGVYFYRKPQTEVPPIYTPPVMGAQNTELKVRLEDFFWQYNVRVGDFAAALRILKEDVRALQTLRKEKEAYDAETQELLANAAKYDQAAKEIFDRYALTEETYEDAWRDSVSYAEAERLEKLKSAKAEAYRLEYALTEEVQVVDGLEEKKVRYRMAQEETRQLRDRIRRIEAELEKLPKLKLDLAEQKEALESYMQEKDLIGVAIAALQSADANLKDAYLLPMQTSFLSFAKKMGAEWADTITIGDDLDLSFEARGQLRRAEHFSDGQRALAALCMRLALMENIHKGEIPFCISDDPFVHLDEQHLEEVKVGLRALSESMQIVYFTCHSSRMI